MLTIQDVLGVSESEFVQLMLDNCSLQGACQGYAAEHIAKAAMEAIPEVTEVTKMFDHDKKHRYDFLVKTQHRNIRVEVKRLTETAPGIKIAKSFKTPIDIGGHHICTTQLPRTSYDVLCIVTPNGVVFMKTCDMPMSRNYKNMPKEAASLLLPRYLKAELIAKRASSDFPLTE